MRVAILTTDLTANGGAPRQAMLLARGLMDAGHDATLYAVHYSSDTCYPELAATVDIRAVNRLSPYAARLRNQQKHHGIFYGAKRHLWESRQLAQLVTEPCDVLNPHARGATRAAVECKRRTGTPVVWMCDDARNWEEPGYRPYYPAPIQWLFDIVMARLEAPVVRQIDRIVALDHRVKNILQNYYGRPGEVVRSGLDATAFRESPAGRERIRARHGIGEHEFLLLWLGIIEPHRRIEDTLEALRLVRLHGQQNVRFLIAGSAAFAPDYFRTLEKLAIRNGLQDWVYFHPEPVPEAEMASYYSAADGLVYLAENQCWALGVFEALACNLPVIVSRACGAHEVLADRRTAMLVSPRSPNDLARAIADLATIPGLRGSLSRHARAEVLDQITWNKYTENMLQVFERAIGHPSSPDLSEREEAFA